MKTLYRRPDVHLDECIGCRNCERKCPSEAMHVFLMQDLATDDPAPCTKACPAHIDVMGYVGLVGDGRFSEAYDLIMKHNPFPSVCGRVCTHPCEGKCNRGKRDEPIAIRDIKRFVADRAFEGGEPTRVEPLPDNGHRVAVVGAGPSGLTCAYYLRLKGYEVHVFEQEGEPGGILMYGIPEYRLPKAVLRREIDHIISSGIHMHYDVTLGRDRMIEGLRDEFDAVYLALGTQFSKSIGIPGEDKKGVIHALDFLRDVHFGRPVDLGKRLVVVGGGDTALDVARTARRLGCEDVTILYRRRRCDMPATELEVVEALEEGVKLEKLASPLEVLGDDHVTGVSAVRMRVIGTDDSGRAKIACTDDVFTLECDTVIAAVSQYFDLPFTDAQVFERNSRGVIITDAKTDMTSVDGVFAGGDMEAPDVAITAIAAGRRSAIQIDRHLGGDGELYTGDNIRVPMQQHVGDMFSTKRFDDVYLPLEEREGTFDECVLTHSEEEIVAEARRCIRCQSGYRAACDNDLCVDCGFCSDFCPQKAISFVQRDKPEPRPITIRPENERKILEMCRNAKLYPNHLCCVCYNITAQDICEVILEGATTVLDIIRRIGFASGCAKYCPEMASRILVMNGYDDKPLDYDQFYLYKTMACRDVSGNAELCSHYPSNHLSQEVGVYYKPELMTDDKIGIWYPDAVEEEK